MKTESSSVVTSRGRIIMVLVLSMVVFVVNSMAFPRQLEYQGEIPGYTGIATTYFSLINAAAPDTATENWWTNDANMVAPGTRPVSGVTTYVNDGKYTIYLGDTSYTNMKELWSSTFVHEPVYLRVWYKAGSNSVVQVGSDRRIVSVGYAMNALRLDGNSVGNLSENVPVSNGKINTNLNADLLDGLHGANYRNASNLNKGVLPAERLVGSYSSASVDYANWAGNASSADNAISASSSDNSNLLNGQSGSYYLNAGNLTGTVVSSRLIGEYGSATVGYSADAELLNGQNGSYYLDAGNQTGVVASGRLVGQYDSATAGYAADAGLLNGQNSSYYLDAGNLTGTIASSRLIGEYGSATVGYSADAELLNGQNGSYYLNAGNLTGTIASSRLIGEYGSATVGYTADAGLLNGQNGSYYLDAGNQTGVVPSSRLIGDYSSATVGYTDDAGLLNGQNGSYYLDAGNLTGVLPTSSLVGEYSSATVGYVLDADKVDGLHASEFAKPLYDALVAPSGGDYTSIQDALTAGKKTIYVRNGTYSSWNRILITQNGTSIIGESRDGVLITGYDFMMGGGIYVDGYAGTYSDGSCSAEEYSYYVTGYNVSWTSDMIGRFIKLGEVWYEIAGVPSSNSIMLKNRFYGNNILFTSYQITGFVKDVRLENLSIVSSGFMGENLELNYTKDAVVKNCYISSESMDIFRIWSSIGGLIEDNIIEGSNGNACSFYDSDHFTIRNNVVQQNAWYGLQFYNSDNNMIIGNRLNANRTGIMMYSSNHNLIANNQCKYNEESGIYVNENSEYNQFDSNNCSNNGESGIYCTSTTARSSISNNVCVSNGNSGIIIGNLEAANVDEMVIANNRCESNTHYGIKYCGSDSALTSNICKSNGYDGIYIATSNRNRLTANQCVNNGINGIRLSGSDSNCITNCNATNNSGDGIYISDAACDNTIIIGCHVSGNTSANIIDAGTNTQKGYNYAP